MIEEMKIPRLYYRYKKTDDIQIREYLDKYPIVKLTNKGAGTEHGYYPLSEEALNKLKTKTKRIFSKF